MLAPLSLAMRIIFSPVWILWRGYLLLWWAFGEDDAKPTVGPDGKMTPAPATPKPRGLLMSGFVATGLLSAVSGAIAGGLAGAAEISDSTALAAWLWATAAAAIGTTFMVRKVVRRRRARVSTIRGAAMAAAGAARSAGAAAFKVGVAAGRAGVAAGKAGAVAERASQAAEGAGRIAKSCYRAAADASKKVAPPVVAGAKQVGPMCARGFASIRRVAAELRGPKPAAGTPVETPAAPSA
jgi:hypothetical protein